MEKKALLLVAEGFGLVEHAMRGNFTGQVVVASGSPLHLLLELLTIEPSTET